MTYFYWTKKQWENFFTKNIAFLLVLLAMLSVLSILYSMKPYWEISHNPTHSISKTWFVTHWHAIPDRGQLIVFKNPDQHIYSPTSRFVKYLRGLPGDRLEILGEKVFVNGKLMALANTLGPDGKPLAPLSFNGVIPPKKYLALGTAADSFDSRYADFGLIDEEKILGTGHALPFGPE